jgi:outer membrane protein assembly factor BamB
MITNETLSSPNPQKPLRLWLGVVIVIVQWLVRFGIPLFSPDAYMYAILGEVIGGLAIIVWWLFFSRANWVDRWGALLLMIIAFVCTPFFLHKSITTGNMGLMFTIYSIPILSLTLVLWAVVTHRLVIKMRRIMFVVFLLLANGGWILLRSVGISGYGVPEFAWRWTGTPEDKLLASVRDEAKGQPSNLVIKDTVASWPGFRGPNRDGIIHGIKIRTDWSVSPPVEIWRKPVGPGCSSFAVQGTLLFTQEQRGEYEMVTCYNLNTGELIWTHRDSTRFWDSHAGAGPRSTPTLSNGRVYTLGATGILNVLDSRNGDLIWSRKVADQTNTKTPIWAFSGSPLVVNNTVIVALSGSIIAYDINTGNQHWFNPAGGDCYSSPHLASIGGRMQILLQNDTGLLAFDPSNGQLLWKHLWQGNPILQPAFAPNGDILISVSAFSGIRRIAVTNGNDGWNIKECWTETKFKPNHNDFVIHKGYLYGIDIAGAACIDIENGERKWKGGRYGGQLILLADQDLLMILSEKGELVLVEAKPDQFKELARYKAITGKTWNHPVLVGDIVVVRNTEEMAAFRLLKEVGSSIK